jgi:type II secretory pathway component PulF
MLFGSKERFEFYEVLADYAKEELSVTQAVRIQARRARQRGDLIAPVFTAMETAIANGATLTDALRPWIPPVEAIYITIGEASRTLGPSLERLVRLIERQRAMYAAIRSKLAAPLVYLLVLMAVAVGLSANLIPMLKSILARGVTPPGPVRAFFGLSDFIAVGWPYLLGLSLTLLVLVWITLPNLTGPVRRYLDRIAPWSWYRRVQAAVFLTSMSVMMESGVSMERCLYALSRLASPYMRWHINQMELRLRQGLDGARAMDTELLMRSTMDSIEDYGGLRSFSQAIGKFGARGTQDAELYFQRVAAGTGLVIQMALYAYLAAAFGSMGLVGISVLNATRVGG